MTSNLYLSEPTNLVVVAVLRVYVCVLGAGGEGSLSRKEVNCKWKCRI